MRGMLEGALYLASSFWLGAVHAATPGHGKTVSAAYLVGARGRPADALALGIFVTLAHTSGITLFALLATFGSSRLSQRAEAQLAFISAVLIVAIGVAMLAQQWHRRPRAHAHQEREHQHEHSHFGLRHSHAPARIFSNSNSNSLAPGRPSWSLLLGLGLAGGLLPDPAALAVLLAAMASGKLVLGLLTVLVFSLGFASVLVLVGMLVGRLGQAGLARMNSQWLDWLQVGTASVITLVGVVMTVGAWRQLIEWR
jgi:nickel/cobalt exporter